ncbi:ATP-binding cassette domain-containing protein [Secundilactobacillus malefermentans]|uniref:ATP-binding cassette domain-containing protein n=1 Tax=Secundilactobacillus malefermentans TaxID=176292 RepID=UPI001CDB8181|nr:ATP-binding cassette domain-containing protein [Secundilactobacillus malefermentans]
MTQIKLTHLKKIVAGEPLFDATDLTATTGDVVGIVGNNGTGKTTLMKIIAQQDTDFEGQRTVQGTLSFVHQVNPITDKSGGQETIAKIREALALRPEILILDEPTANLD